MEYKDFTEYINKYYKWGISNHGIEIPIYTTQTNEIIHLSIDIIAAAKDYYYGIKKVYSGETNKKIDFILGKIFNDFKKLDALQ